MISSRKLLWALGLLSSCSSVQIEDVKSQRFFYVKPVWAKTATAEPNERFRKINRMTPLVLGSSLLQGNAQDGIASYNMESGQVLWRKFVEKGVEAPAAEFKNRVYFGGGDGTFYALNAQTGETIWTFNTHVENLAEPLFDEKSGRIFFVSSQNSVYALEADSGKQVWIHNKQDTSLFSIRGSGRPSLKDGLLYVGFSDGSLSALNAETGSSVWEIQLNKNKKFRDIDSTPVIDGDRIYVSGYDDKFYCLSAQKGDLIWKVDGGGYFPATIIGTKVFFSTSSGEVIGLNKETGQKLWTYRLTEGVATQVKPYKGLLVFGESQGSLVFVDPENGKKINSFEPGRGLISTPAVDEKNNRVYFISGEANIYAIDAQWNWKPAVKYIPQ